MKISEKNLRSAIKKKLLKEKITEAKRGSLVTTHSSQAGKIKSGGSGEKQDAGSMSISSDGLENIKDQEGYREHIYDDDTSQYIISTYDVAVGNPTIGVCHLVYKKGGRGKDEREKYKKYLGGKEKMSPDEVNALLATDIEKHTRWKSSLTEPITQNMFDAIADYAFNAGNAAPKRDGVIGAINTGDNLYIRVTL